MPALNMDSWVWKIALVLGLIGAREFVRVFTPRDDSALRLSWTGLTDWEIAIRPRVLSGEGGSRNGVCG